ncbi:hypothetical protein RclHR1_15500007 [Rhizophagus clarus]|uniref:Uncharacterized protein n=1 Tax=Rhizophagus clarus TaxID=94130 RepID=A0A2Z6R819_9GLOM|nr:hypothetical protein RclHR1_15500007 [Rhizophagus clarus]GES87902.1 hypothetical protein RCL_jg11347.t1 [Rhizophagus clarus]
MNISVGIRRKQLDPAGYIKYHLLREASTPYATTSNIPLMIQNEPFTMVLLVQSINTMMVRIRIDPIRAFLDPRRKYPNYPPR